MSTKSTLNDILEAFDNDYSTNREKIEFLEFYLLPFVRDERVCSIIYQKIEELEEN